MLARRRSWHQTIAVVAMIGTTALAWCLRPPMP